MNYKLSSNYLNIGYSNTDVKIHLNKIYSMPLFYVLMTILGFVIINKLKSIKSKFFVIIFGVCVSCRLLFKLFLKSAWNKWCTTNISICLGSSSYTFFNL